MEPEQNLVPGVTEGCYALRNTHAQYHAAKDVLSNSMIKKLLRSAAHLKASQQAEKAELASQRLGTGMHAALLEPGVFAGGYVVFAGYRKGKEYDTFVEANGGKVILNEVEHKSIVGMRDAVLAYDEIDLGRAIKIGTSELSIYWTDGETGVKCRIRPDSFSQYGALDLKSTDDARPEAFARQAARLGYDIQAAMYSEGLRRFFGELPFYFVAVEESAPHGVWVHKASVTFLAAGTRKFRAGLRLFKHCQETGQWPCYRGSFTELDLPRWAE